MTPAEIRRRLRRLEQAFQDRETRSTHVSLWDIVSGAADWDELDDRGKDFLRLLENAKTEECPIEKKIREAALPASANGVSSPESLDASNAHGEPGRGTSGPV
jgi:hypothetical protein